MSYAFGNVNVGANPGDGTGDPLRVAFNTINNNFANIASGNITVTAPVLSVAGRRGNITLTVNDIIGAASTSYVTTEIASAEFASSSYGNATVAVYLAANVDPTIQEIEIDIVALESAIYSNSNVASYLITNTGNISANNISSIKNISVGGFLTLANAVQFANLTTTQIANISPVATGMTVYNYSTGNIQVYNGTKWGNLVLS